MQDKRVPDQIRECLNDDPQQVEQMQKKLSMNLSISSALKLSTGGLSTILTASPRAVVYYGNLVIGKADQPYF